MLSTQQVLSTSRVPQWTTADRLRKAREYAGLDQRQLADEMGVSRNSVSNYEHGHVQPRKIVLRAWAMVTGVPYEWLVDGELPRPDSNREPAGYGAPAPFRAAA